MNEFVSKDGVNTDLVDYLTYKGCQIVRSQQGYRVKFCSFRNCHGDLSSLSIFPDRHAWKRWSNNTWGSDAIQFCRDVLGMSFQEAVFELRNMQPMPEREMNAYVSLSLAQSQKRVIAYLCKKRGISYDIVRMLLQSGKLGQDEHGNCVFYVQNTDGVRIGAELHGTGDTRFKGYSSARQGFGFSMSAGTVRTVAYFESAIDLLSFYQLYRNGIYDYLLVSLGGLIPSVVWNYAAMYPYARHLLFVDHDQAGRNFAVRMHMCVKYPPVGKDWNEYLRIKLMK